LCGGAYSGSGFLYAKIESASIDRQAAFYQEIDVIAGATYDVSVWAKMGFGFGVPSGSANTPDTTHLMAYDGPAGDLTGIGGVAALVGTGADLDSLTANYSSANCGDPFSQLSGQITATGTQITLIGYVDFNQSDTTGHADKVLAAQFDDWSIVIASGGSPQTDSDGDGAIDCLDPCPLDNPDDPDGDSVCQSDDNCPNDSNSGQEDCNSNGVGDACDTINPTAAEECDGIDNDCDGLTDGDDPDLGTGPACALQDGVCAGSTQTCSGGTWQSCGATEYGLDYETEETLCDSLDNDCDAETDEGCSLCTAGPVLTAAASRKTHGPAGDWDIDVGAGDIESRSLQVGTPAASTLTIVATFDIDVALAGGSDVLTDNGTVTAVTPLASNVLQVDISGLGANGTDTGPFNTQVNLSFPGVYCLDGDPVAHACASSMCMRVIVGNFNGDPRTNFLDFSLAKNAYINQLVNSVDMARADFDCSSRPTFLDFSKAKNAGLINQTAPICSAPISP
jgi:hypothetical protein